MRPKISSEEQKRKSAARRRYNRTRKNARHAVEQLLQAIETVQAQPGAIVRPEELGRLASAAESLLAELPRLEGLSQAQADAIADALGMARYPIPE